MNESNWAIVDTDNSVVERFLTRGEAIAALPKHEPGCTVEFSPEPEWFGTLA